MNHKFFRMPQVLITGSGSAASVGAEISKLGKTKALIVTDEILLKLGTLDGIKQSLEEANIGYEIFCDIKGEPTDTYVTEGLKIFKDSGSDIIIACGGGSPIDTAKAISIMATNPGSINDYIGIGNVKEDGVPMVAIPTTAGTGSEVSIFTIITDTAKDVKMLIGSPQLMPRISLVDPLLTLNMPKGLTAAVGVDALTHAIEAYVSVKAQPMTDLLALEAIRLLAGNLRQAWANGQNVTARENTMMGSMLAGLAFSNASVALVHGMSRPIGAYFHVPHGISNAVLLGPVMDFSLVGNPARYKDVAEAMGEDVEGLTDMEGAKIAAEAVKELIADLEIPSLSKLGVDKEKLDKHAAQMAKDAIASGSPGNNPRKASEEEIVALYYVAL